MHLRVVSTEVNRMNKNMGLIRVGAGSPAIKVAGPAANADNIIAIMNKAAGDRCGILVLPRLCITGSTCGDLFFQDALYEAQLTALKKILESSREHSLVTILGCYLRLDNALVDCAAVIQRGEILGVVPKMFGDNRHFASASDFSGSEDCIRLFGKTVPFGNVIFEDEEAGLDFGIEIDDDMLMPVSPGSMLALAGADIVFNPASGIELVRGADFRRSQIVSASAKSMCGYVYASSGSGESTSDMIYGGHCLIAEGGRLLMESTRFESENQITYTEIDFSKLNFERLASHGFHDCSKAYRSDINYKRILLAPLTTVVDGESLFRRYSRSPFIPEDPAALAENCKEIFTIQSTALARRLAKVGAKSAVIGISGGLDSTLALLVCAQAMKILGRPASDITAVTMPGFGTTDRTYRNALVLMRKLGTTVREISIADSVTQHFRDIGYDESLRDVTYENSQARERTQILMDIANMNGGFVVGTGDLSEGALGWCTFNGDHISMYNVNCGVPKTMIPHILGWIKEHNADDEILAQTIGGVIDTPISPELLPPDASGNIQQKTEESVGPYELNDFFLYYTIRYGMSPAKLRFIACKAFSGTYDYETITKWLKVFYRRFITQQFKRNCVPDGPKVGTVGLSPRGDWVMPADADISAFLVE